MRYLAGSITRRFGFRPTRTFTMSASAGKPSRMQRWFPGTAHPLIVSAPMAFVTTPKLAAEVSRADGLGA